MAQEGVLLDRVEADYFGLPPLEVSETISIVSEGRDFKYGIIRVFPMYPLFELPPRPWWSLGSAPTPLPRPQSSIKIISVSRDDAPVGWRSVLNHSDFRLRIGGEDLLTPGRHDYSLRYDLNDSILERDQGVEFEVSTAIWSFPVEQSVIVVSVPARFEDKDISIVGKIYSGSSREVRDNSNIRIVPIEGKNSSRRAFQIEMTKGLRSSECLAARVSLRRSS